MRTPSIPKTIVYLGDAVELDADTYEWKWTKKHNFVVGSSTDGKRLFIFEKRKSNSDFGTGPSDFEKGEKLFQAFSGRNADKKTLIMVPTPKKRVGTAHHIAYKSDKFGPCQSFLHVFDNPPPIWSDDPDDPGILALTGKLIRVTKRGIEG